MNRWEYAEAVFTWAEANNAMGLPARFVRAIIVFSHPQPQRAIDQARRDLGEDFIVDEDQDWQVDGPSAELIDVMGLLGDLGWELTAVTDSRGERCYTFKRAREAA